MCLNPYLFQSLVQPDTWSRPQTENFAHHALQELTRLTPVRPCAWLVTPWPRPLALVRFQLICATVSYKYIVQKCLNTVYEMGLVLVIFLICFSVADVCPTPGINAATGMFPCTNCASDTFWENARTCPACPDSGVTRGPQGALSEDGCLGMTSLEAIFS